MGKRKLNRARRRKQNKKSNEWVIYGTGETPVWSHSIETIGGLTTHPGNFSTTGYLNLNNFSFGVDPSIDTTIRSIGGFTGSTGGYLTFYTSNEEPKQEPFKFLKSDDEEI